MTLGVVCLEWIFDPGDSDTTKMFSSGSEFPDTMLTQAAINWWEQPARVILAFHLRCMVDKQFDEQLTSSSTSAMLRRYETARNQLRDMGEMIACADEVGLCCQLPQQIPLLRCSNMEEVMQVLKPGAAAYSDSHSLIDPRDPRTECIPECVLQTLAEWIEEHDKDEIEDCASYLFELLQLVGKYHHVHKLSSGGQGNLTHVTCFCRERGISESEPNLDILKARIIRFFEEKLQTMKPVGLILRGSLWIILLTAAPLSLKQSQLLVGRLNEGTSSKGRFRHKHPAEAPFGMLRLARELPFNGERPVCMLWKQHEVGTAEKSAVCNSCVPPASILHELGN